MNTDNDSSFPRTHWSRLAAVKSDVSLERQQALNFLAERYWKPVYCYVRRRGYGEEEAKDSVQQFFLNAFGKELFAKADSTRGRFRNFLLKSLVNFLAKEWRDAHAQKRQPANGFLSIHELASEAGSVAIPSDTRTPEEAFHRNWLRELILRVLRELDRECQLTSKQMHFELFRQRVMLPILDGSESPSLRDLAVRHGLTEKDVENRVITARRAYQRLLRREIKHYASSDQEVADELQDIWRCMSE